jgi:hypothetical protein
MDDRQLLELAAKAVGVSLDWRSGSCCYYYDDEETGREEWNPLDDDRQAFRLAVKLELTPYGPLSDYPWAACQNQDASIDQTVPAGDDPYAATRRAIVRAAAELAAKVPA